MEVILCSMCHKYWFLQFYLLVFLTLLMLCSYCAHLVGGSTWIVLQLVQDLMSELKSIVELHTIQASCWWTVTVLLFFSAALIFFYSSYVCSDIYLYMIMYKSCNWKLVTQMDLKSIEVWAPVKCKKIKHKFRMQYIN